MWVRGLKLAKYGDRLKAAEVAPYVGAWIETILPLGSDASVESHPMWVRGLKQ